MSLQTVVGLKEGGECVVTHVPSGEKLSVGKMTDPKFSPLHLVGAGLGT